MAGKTQQGVKQLKPESGIFKFEKNMVNPTECMCDSDSWFLTYFDYSNQEDSSFDAYPQFALIQDSNNERKYTMPRIRLNDVNRCIKIKIASDFSKKSKFDNIGRVGLLQFPLPEDSEEIPLSDFLGKDYDERDLHICPFLRHNQLRTDLVRIVKIDRKNSNFNINEEQQSVVLKEPIEPLTELVMTQTIEQGGTVFYGPYKKRKLANGSYNLELSSDFVEPLILTIDDIKDIKFDLKKEDKKVFATFISETEFKSRFKPNYKGRIKKEMTESYPAGDTVDNDSRTLINIVNQDDHKSDDYGLTEIAENGSLLDSKEVLRKKVEVVNGVEDDAVGLIDLIQERINERGRNLERNDVINLMICLTQGYVLTLAGNPGTGKTSLVKILANALGLNQDSDQRFVEVWVERGWTSYKDFIGYYNPLVKENVKVNPALFDGFARLSNEVTSGVGDDSKPFYVLLDEANLSPIEYYWANFLHECDDFRKPNHKAILPLSVDDDRSNEMRLSKNLRWIATVNFDHTTEELSPRFLDRSWVIRLDGDNLKLEDLYESHGKRDDGNLGNFEPITTKELQSVFGGDAYELNNGSLDKLTSIFDICEQFGMLVSPRSKLMICNYVATASNLMEVKEGEGVPSKEDVAIDYAISQKLLPLVNGVGDGLENILSYLSSKELKGAEQCPCTLRRTKKQAERMLEFGDKNHGYYQFFV